MSLRIQTRQKRATGIATFLFISTALCAPAFAQIETVVVTAQKKVENIQTVPIAVTAFTAEDLAAHQIVQFKDLVFSTPNVSYSKTNFTGADFQIRGIGIAAIAGDAESGVAVHEDDVYLADPPLAEANFYDLDRVEVLRGPQSTLYGRGATGGTVNIITAKADPGQFAANGEATYGNYNTMELKGMVNLPIVSDVLAVRVAGDWSRHDGYVLNINNGQHYDNENTYSVRGSARYAPTQDTTIDLVASISKENDHKMRSQKQLCTTDVTGTLGCLPDSAGFGAVNANATLSNIASSQQAIGGFGFTIGQAAGAATAAMDGLSPGDPGYSALVNGTGAGYQAAFTPMGLLDLTKTPTLPAGDINPTNLRQINTDFVPVYQAKEDFIALNVKQNINSWLNATLVGGYEDHSTFSQESYTLSVAGAEEEDETTEDKINRIIESRKLVPNASYFAFTATPKNKTLQIFGVPYRAGDEVKHRPFHSYTMKQAIQEGFILDVLKQYTPVESYYRLAKTVEGDPEFDVKKARKKLRVYVESHSKAIRDKAEIMVDHFQEQVISQNKIGGQARAMVVTGSIQRAIQYFFAFREYLEETKSLYKAIVAFSGEPEYKGEKVTEAKLNGFPSNDIADRIQEDPYRFLICADKFQTGYDEPLLHTMYVDKVLSGIKAVQTLSRLNRAHPKKHDVFVLDFQNDTEMIQDAFAAYYRTTILSKETDPNKLHTLKADLDGYQVYTPDQISSLVDLYLNGADRDKLDPILDACVSVYLRDLDEDGQVDFKSKAKAFTRTYDFLASILPYGIQEWEKLSILLNFLISKLPAPIEEDLAIGILEAIDMDSYRAEKKAIMAIALPDEDVEIEPVPTSAGGKKPEPELDKLSNIVRAFNDQFGGLFSDPKRMEQRITDEIPTKVSADRAYQNARQNSDRQNARIEHDKALKRVITALFTDDAQLFKQFQDNESFRHWLTDTVFGITYEDQSI